MLKLNRQQLNRQQNKMKNKVKNVERVKHLTKNNNMEWGTVTWTLFHWLAANIDEEFYKKSFRQLHSIILAILYNLPCPTCKNHAIEFTKKYNIINAQTKGQFIQYFYFFHNKVNDRKNIVNPNISILDRYTTMNGIEVINNWINKYKNNLGININDFMNKQNIAGAKQRMINFIRANKEQFSNL